MMKQCKRRHVGWAMIAQGVALLQVGACLSDQFVQDAAQSIIVGRVVDAFAFFLDQIFFRLGI